MMRVVILLFLLAAPLFAEEAADVAEDIRGAKPLIEVAVPEPAVAWGLYLFIGLVALVLIAGIIFWIRKRSGSTVTVEVWARGELDELQRGGGEMDASDFAMAASRVVRGFVERKFGLAAPKRTTEEFLKELSLAEDEGLVSRMEPLRGFLKSCDMAKFAGAGLQVAEREVLIEKAKAFVAGPDVSGVGEEVVE